jgi:hypothetical protein
VFREPVEDREEGEYDERSEVERVEIVDMSRSVSDFAKTKPKFTAGEGARGEEREEAGKI